MKLSQFIGEDQLKVMRANCRGEEGQYFRDMIGTLKETIAVMPKSYETDGQGNDAIATLHYFNCGSDWYITERDAGSPDDEEQGVQAQAFGYACLNGDYENAELGYISIQELIENGVELDLYYRPETIGTIKERLNKRMSGHQYSEGTQPTIETLNDWMNEGICEAIDGCCPIELDGHCEHNSPSWFLHLGLI